jgi:hypothetical protein
MYQLFSKLIAQSNFTKYIRTYWWLTILIFIALPQLKSPAIQYPDGKLAFESAILLVDTHTTFDEVRVKQAKYYFDLELPKNVGESLGKVIIKQRTGGDEIKFKPEQTKAYIGNHNQKQAELNLATQYNQDTGLITVKFEPPIPPPSKLTIALKPKSNPDLAGVYLFGLTAFPPGEKSLGLNLGSGRLEFDQSDSFDF